LYNYIVAVTQIGKAPIATLYVVREGFEHSSITHGGSKPPGYIRIWKVG